MLLAALLAIPSLAAAATCTSKASGNWTSATTWNCTAGTTPAAADTVILASPFVVSLGTANRTAAVLTINAGATLNDNGRDLTISTGSVINNGTFGTGGGALIMNGASATLSGTGTFDDTDVQIDAAGISLPSGSTMTFIDGAQLRVGRDNSGTFTLDGTIQTGSPWSSGDRILRVYEGSSAAINGTISASTAYIMIEQNASLTNNGSVTVREIDSDGNNSTSVWTQGVGASLTVSRTNNWSGTLYASATNNTVTYTASVTPMTPVSNTYYNIGHPTCSSVSGFTILGSSPCPPTVSSISRTSTNPTAPATSVSWTVVFSTSVTGVDSTDFSLAQSGVSGASITGVSGSGTAWTVTANTGSGTGTLGLNLTDDDSIVNAYGLKLGGTGSGNGNFTGETYRVTVLASCNSGAIPSGIVNTYYPGAASVAAGATSISVGSASGAATAIAANDVLLVIQMQDENIGTRNDSRYGSVSGTPTAGQYEYVLAADSVSGGVLTLSSALTKSYTAAAYDGTNGQKTFQVIRIPAYYSATLPASGLTAQAWNGSTGGVLVLDVKGTLNLNGATVDVSGKGFRGGGGCRWVGSTTGGVSSSDYRRTASATCPSTSRGDGAANGLKGEGIAGTPRYVYDGSARVDTGVEGYRNGSTARGAPGNAGGGGTDDDPGNNDENTGGGGGAGYGGGGTGGYAWSNGSSPGRGLGGTGVAESATKLTLGGGAGAGSSNNGTADGNGLNSSGVAGGGIVMIRAGQLSGSATFSAKGSNNDLDVKNDGSGGGGGGGAVLISAGGDLSNVTIDTGGGNGGTNDAQNTGAHGPGGGGGGGYAMTTSAPSACTAAGGSPGLTTNTGDGDANTNYGASAGSNGLCATNGSLASSIPGTALGAGACATAVDHYAIGHSGSGITCEAEPVTFTAHDASHARVDAGGNTLSITATNSSGGAGSGTWVAADGSVCSIACYDTSGTAKASCSNTPTYTTVGTSTGTASYLFASGESGIRLCLKQSSAITQNINVSDGTATEHASEDATLAFANTGFRFYAGDVVDTLGNLVAGLRSDTTDATYQPAPQTLTVRALKTSETTPARCVPLIGSTTKTVKFAYQCIDPATCHASSTGLEINGTAVTGSGDVPTPASDVSVAFNASGYGSINLKYWDVGQIKLYASAAIADAATGGTATIAAGASNTFLVKPFGFAVIPCTTLTAGACASAPADPGTTGGGNALIKAGNTFNATVKAVAYDSSTVTPSFGLGTSNDTESVALSYTLIAPLKVCGAGTTDCTATLGGTTAPYRSAFTDGIKTFTDLTWSEAGVITVKATNSVFQGTTLSPAAVGTSGNLGRFYPHHFSVTGAVLSRSDLGANASTFTYMDEPMRLTFNVTALNAAEVATKNYASDFAKLNATGTGSLGSTLANWTCTSGTQCMGVGTVSGTTDLTARLSIDTTGTGSSAPSNTAWSNGSSAFTAYMVFARPAAGTVDGPYKTLKTGAKPRDSDGVTIPPRNSADVTHCVDLDITTGTENAACDPGATEANLRRKVFTTDVRFGRLSVANASGSERQPLAVGASVMYYNGNPTGWVLNTDDSHTALPSAFAAHAANTSADACYGAACTGNTGGTAGSLWLHDIGATSIAQAAAPTGSSAMAAGRGAITLGIPSIAATPTPGTLEMTLVVPAWLKAASGKNGTAGNYDWDPTGRVTFGVYGPATNKSRIIFIRESY